jgi:hypothetical protein
VLAVLPFICAAAAVAVVPVCRLVSWALWLRFVRDVYRTSGSLEAIGAMAPIAKSFLWQQDLRDSLQSSRASESDGTVNFRGSEFDGARFSGGEVDLSEAGLAARATRSA